MNASGSKKLLDASINISINRASIDDATFIHSIMCQVGLPRSKVEGMMFERRCAGASLIIEAGKIWDGEKFVQQEIPYGPLPRLILAWMNGYAVRNKTPEVWIGGSASEFMKLLGRSVTGGKTGSINNFKKQIQALAASSLTLGFTVDGHAHTFSGRPIKHFEAWLGSEQDKQKNFWPGKIIFTDDYFKSLIEKDVPIDMRAYSALKGSALAMDVYCWAAERLHRIKGRPVILHWANLREQFGQEYTGKNADKDFKRNFIKALDKVSAVYPLARIKKVPTGLLLIASSPPIPYRD